MVGKAELEQPLDPMPTQITIWGGSDGPLWVIRIAHASRSAIVTLHALPVLLNVLLGRDYCTVGALIQALTRLDLINAKCGPWPSSKSILGS